MQMFEDGSLSAAEAFASGPFSEVTWVTQEVAEEFCVTVNGFHLDEKMVRPARVEELEWVENADLLTAVPWSEATWEPITLMWVDTNKGDDAKPNYRSRFVLRGTRPEIVQNSRWRPRNNSRARRFWRHFGRPFC